MGRLHWRAHAERRGPRRRRQHPHVVERLRDGRQLASDRCADGSLRWRPRGRHDLGHGERVRQRRGAERAIPGGRGDVGSADTSSPYSLSLNTTTLSNGTHTLTAVARDTAGNTRTSSNVSITVDNQVPTVALTAPANGASISGTTTVTASASDNVAVQSVEFRVDGAAVATDTSAPYTMSGATSWLADGTHTFSAVARDTAGNTRTSANVTVTVDNNAPSVSIGSPDGRHGGLRHHQPSRRARPTRSACRACSSGWTARTSARPTRAARTRCR